MNVSAGKRIRIRRLAGYAAVGALVLRALIPVGYMPGDLTAGEFMVLCPNGPSGELILQAFGGAHHHHDGAGIDADKACPIGVTLKYAAIPSQELPNLWQPRLAAAYIGNHTAVADRLAPPAFRPRAPPRFHS